MTSPLLLTKLYFPPARPTLTARPRLVQRLQDGLRGPLTLICAPAGYGKTTLMAEWRAAAPPDFPVAWLSLDPGDNDPQRFYQYLAASLDSLAPGLQSQLQVLLEAPTPPEPEIFLTPLLNTLSQLRSDFVLALDDYHVIDTPSIHAALLFLLEHCPPNMHLALLTRSDPPLPLARLRAGGHLTEIRAGHLRFTLDECTQFLEKVMDLHLEPAQIQALEKRTEGWIAGLQLAALSLQGQDDLPGFIACFTGSHHYIVDYLAEEALAKQPEAVRDFLIQTCLLERLNGPLCEAVTGQPGGQAMLEKLLHDNLFLTPLDGERRWFRYHQLFADLLRSRLHNQHPELIPELHRRAAAWFARHNLVPDAIEHLLAAQEYPAIGRLLREAFPGWMRTESWNRIIQWFEQLPQDYLHAEPWLCVVYAWLFWRRAKAEQAEAYLDIAERAYQRMQDENRLPVGDLEYDGLPAEIYAFRALIATIGDDPQRVIDLANQALAIVPEKAHTVKSIAYLALNAIYRDLGLFEQAIEACNLGLPQAILGGETGTIVSYHQSMGIIHTVQGRRQQAMQSYHQALVYAESKGESHLPAYGLIRLRLADLHYQWNQLDEAQQWLNNGLEPVDFAGNHWGMVYGRYLRCLLHAARGNQAALQTVMDEIDEILAKTSGAYYEAELKRMVALMKAKLGVSIEPELLELSLPAALQKDPRTSQIEELILKMHICLALERLEQVPEVLAWLETITSRRGHQLWLIETLILQARVFNKTSQRQRALDCLERALALAEPAGLVRVFLTHGQALQGLLQAALARLQAHSDPQSPGSAGRFCQYLLESAAPATPQAARMPATQAAQPAGQQPSGVASSPPLRTPLSPRELELLALIAAGRSNKEIAAQLFIAIGTVKRHTVNIFTKLDAQNRTEAVAKARDLGLL